MAFLATNLINGVLLVLLFIIYFFFKNKFLHIGAALTIIILLFQMQVPTILLLVVSLFLVGTSYSFLFQKRRGILMMGLLLLLLPMAMATSHNTIVQPDNTGATAPSGYEGGPPDMIIEIRELNAVRRITAQPRLSFLGTDYLPGDQGKLQAFVTVGENPVSSSACYASVLYPNETYFLQNVVLNPVVLPYFDGLYTYDFIVPDVTGIYPVMAHCFFNVTTENSYMTNSSGNYSVEKLDIDATNELDGVLYEFNGGPICKDQYCDRFFRFNQSTGWNSSFLSEVRMFLWAHAEHNRDYNFSIYNALNDSYEFLVTLRKDNINDETLLQFPIPKNYVNGSEFIFRMRIYDGDGQKIDFDLFKLLLSYNGTNMIDLRQNQELVVSKVLTNATTLIIQPPPQEILSGESILNLLLLVGIGISLIGGLSIAAGFLLVLWTIIYSTNIYITMSFLLFALYLFYSWARGKGQ